MNLGGYALVLENYQMIKLHIYISLFFIFFFFSSLPLISTLQLWLTLKQVEPLWASLVSTLKVKTSPIYYNNLMFLFSKILFYLFYFLFHFYWGTFLLVSINFI